MAAVALDVDADRCVVGAQEFGPGQCEGDQQDVVDPGVERRGHLAEQQAGGLGVQRCRQVPGAGIGIQLGLHRGQRGRGGRDLSPACRPVR